MTDTSTGGQSTEIEALVELVAGERQRQGIQEPREVARVRPVVPEVVQPVSQQVADSYERRARAHRVQKSLAALTAAAGEHYRDCRMDTFVCDEQHPRIAAIQQNVVAGMMEYCQTMPQRLQAGEGLVAYGPCGTGKDHLVCAAASGAIRVHDFSVIWLNGQAWFGRMRDKIQTDESEQDEIRRLVSPDILVVSDPLPPIGTLTAHQSRMLCWVLDARYRANKVSWATVNIVSADQAVDLMGAPLWERLIDRCWEFFCQWPSYRKPARTFGATQKQGAKR